jgi:hypothetical protein
MGMGTAAANEVTNDVGRHWRRFASAKLTRDPNASIPIHPDSNGGVKMKREHHQENNVALLNTDSWKIVARDGNPEPGLYMAIYTNGRGMLPVALCSYGHYDFFNEDCEDADDNGMVHRFGWSEEIEQYQGEFDSLTFDRDVIAYLPINFDTANSFMLKTLASLDGFLGTPRSTLDDVRASSTSAKGADHG